jgi:hypothetical protein
MEANERNNTNTKFFWLAIAVLTGLSIGLGYLYLHERKINMLKEEALEKQIQERLEAKVKIDSISQQLSFKILEINKLGGEVASLKKIKDQLEADKILLSARKIPDMRGFERKIADYQKVLDEKDIEIVKLRSAFGQLTNKNDQLNTENEGLKNERKQLSDSINAVTAQNKLLADKVTKAAALRAETINVYAISGRGRERDGGNYNARRIDKLRVSFHLVDNPLTALEEKDIFLRLLDPSGTVLSDMATGSGIFAYNGQDLIYTIKKRERYVNTHQLVEIIYSRNLDYKPGKYQIELYAEGYMIGRGGFDVKQ